MTPKGPLVCSFNMYLALKSATSHALYGKEMCVLSLFRIQNPLTARHLPRPWLMYDYYAFVHCPIHIIALLITKKL